MAFAVASMNGKFDEARGIIFPPPAQAQRDGGGDSRVHGGIRARAPARGRHGGDTLGLIYKKKEYVYAARLITIEHGPDGIDNISEL